MAWITKKELLDKLEGLPDSTPLKVCIGRQEVDLELVRFTRNEHSVTFPHQADTAELWGYEKDKG